MDDSIVFAIVHNNVTHAYLRASESTTQTASRSVQPFRTAHGRVSSGMPGHVISPKNFPLTWGDLDPSNTWFLGPPESTPQTAVISTRSAFFQCRRTRTVQSYSSDGANMHPCVTHASLGAYESTQTAISITAASSHMSRHVLSCKIIVCSHGAIWTSSNVWFLEPTRVSESRSY